MSGSGFTQLDLFSPRAAASPAEAARRLPDDYDRYGTCRRARRVMKAAVCGVQHASGWTVQQSGTADAWLVTGHRDQRTGAGR